MRHRPDVVQRGDRRAPRAVVVGRGAARRRRDVPARGGGGGPPARRGAAQRGEGCPRSVARSSRAGARGSARRSSRRWSARAATCACSTWSTGSTCRTPRAWEDVGPVDLACLNAGVVTGERLVGRVSDEQYRRIVGVNLDGVFFGVRRLARVMRGGSIVVTASLGGLTGMDNDPLYSMTKHALVGFVRSTAPQLAERGIRLNMVNPGIVDTPLLDDGGSRRARGGRIPAAAARGGRRGGPARGARRGGRTGVGRPARPRAAEVPLPGRAGPARRGRGGHEAAGCERDRAARAPSVGGRRPTTCRTSGERSATGARWRSPGASSSSGTPRPSTRSRASRATSSTAGSSRRSSTPRWAARAGRCSSEDETFLTAELRTEFHRAARPGHAARRRARRAADEPPDVLRGRALRRRGRAPRERPLHADPPQRALGRGASNTVLLAPEFRALAGSRPRDTVSLEPERHRVGTTGLAGCGSTMGQRTSGSRRGSTRPAAGGDRASSTTADCRSPR